MANPKRTRTVGEDIQVTVIRSGGRPQRRTLQQGATIEDAIADAGFTVKPKDQVSVNGQAAHDLSQEVEDADRIMITPKFEGGK